MSVNRDHQLMKDSFIEARDIINQIFTAMRAPEYYFVKHMTFDELVVALYRLLHVYEELFGDNANLTYIVDTSDGTASSDDILFGKIAYSKGQRIEGNIVSFPSHTYIPTTIDIVIPMKHYLEGDQILKGDVNLTPENIRYTSQIFNVNGTFTSDANITANDILENKIGYSKGQRIVGNIHIQNMNSDIVLDEEYAEQEVPIGYHSHKSRIRIQTQEKYGHPSTQEQIIEPDDNHVLSRVFIDGDEDLIPKNIRQGTTIFGVTGTLEEFTKYNIIYVINSQRQTAYQQQVEYDQQFSIIGTHPFVENHEFKGWSPDPQATYVAYQPGQLVTTNLTNKGGTYILYAVFEEYNLTDISLDLVYDNNGRLTNGKEIVTVIINGGNLSNGYSLVTREVTCDNVNFLSKFTDETNTSYKNKIQINNIGYYPITVVHTYNNKRVTANKIIKVMGENGSMKADGTMTYATNPTVSYFDSGWTNLVTGCWISQFTYNYKSGNSHGSDKDELAVFGRTSSGKMILLYDFGAATNLRREISLGNISPNDIYNGGSYKLSLGGFTLSNDNLSTKQWTITDSYNRSDDIRQLRFFASSNHGSSCFSNNHIDYDIKYEFDMDLWDREK